MSWWISHLTALLIGFCLDLLLGDPHWAFPQVSRR